MTRNEYIEIRIAELTARQNKARQYVMNPNLNREVELIQAQLDALNELHDFELVPVEGIKVVEHDRRCAHRWNVPDGGMIQDGAQLECEKCGAIKGESQ